MKTTKTYSAPCTEVRKTRVRMSILAGSDNAINGVSGGNTTVPSMPWDNGARIRTFME